MVDFQVRPLCYTLPIKPWLLSPPNIVSPPSLLLVTPLRIPLTTIAETKELKRRVRDCIDPSRDLGHVDGPKGKSVNPNRSTGPTANSVMLTEGADAVSNTTEKVERTGQVGSREHCPDC